MDRSSKILSIETGVGFGVTAGADKLTFQADAVARSQLNICHILWLCFRGIL
jgi:hypothetical protein